MKMGHRTSGSRSSAALSAGESCNRRSVRNQYKTLAFPIMKRLCHANKSHPANRRGQQWARHVSACPVELCEAFLVWMVMEDLAPTLALTQIHDVSTTVNVPEWSLAAFAHLVRIVMQRKRLNSVYEYMIQTMSCLAFVGRDT